MAPVFHLRARLLHGATAQPFQYNPYSVAAITDLFSRAGLEGRITLEPIPTTTEKSRRARLKSATPFSKQSLAAGFNIRTQESLHPVEETAGYGLEAQIIVVGHSSAPSRSGSLARRYCLAAPTPRPGSYSEKRRRERFGSTLDALMFSVWLLNRLSVREFLAC